MTSSSRQHTERRNGPDWLSRSIRWLTIAGWLLFIAGLLVTHYASPDMDTGLVRYWQLEINSDWHPELTRMLMYMLWGCIVLSGISLLFNRLRLRRRSDRVYFNIILLLLSSLGLLLYLLWQV